MLLKRNPSMSLSNSVVKTSSKLLGLAGLAFMASTGAQAQAYPVLIEKEVKVSIPADLFKSETGIETAHAMMTQAAIKFCENDRKTLKYLGETQEVCIADLVNQMVIGADNALLTTYHQTSIFAK